MTVSFSFERMGQQKTPSFHPSAQFTSSVGVGFKSSGETTAPTNSSVLLSTLAIRNPMLAPMESKLIDINIVMASP